MKPPSLSIDSLRISIVFLSLINAACPVNASPISAHGKTSASTANETSDEGKMPFKPAGFYLYESVPNEPKKLTELKQEESWLDRDKDLGYINNSDCGKRSIFATFGAIAKNKGNGSECHFFENLKHPSAVIQTAARNPVFVVYLTNNQDIRDIALVTCTVKDDNRLALIRTVKGASLKDSFTLHKTSDGNGYTTGPEKQKVDNNFIDPINRENLIITQLQPSVYKVELKTPLVPGEYAFQQAGGPAATESTYFGFGISQANNPAAPPAPLPPPPPPIAPPPPPPDEPAAPPPTISLGQTKDQVQSAFGPPVRVVKLGAKEIEYFKDMKVTFVNGKVTDVQ